jgi:hypothetical protein
MSLTEVEVDVVRQNLQQTTDFRVFPLLVETALWAIYTVLISISTYLAVFRGLQTRSKKTMLAFMLVMYLLSTLDWAIDVRRVWTDLKISIPGELNSPPRDESSLNTENVILRIIQAITNNLCVFIGDLVVCWRVCVVYRWDKRIIVTAVILLTIFFSSVSLCNLTQIGEGFPEIEHLHILVPSQLTIDAIALTFTALVNLWATVMIGLRVWKCRRRIQLHLASIDRKSYTEKVLTLFVETGIVYTVLWALKNIIIIPRLALTAYTNYAIFVMNQAVGMYPTLILVLVVLQQSHLEFQLSYDDSDSSQSTSLVFSRTVQRNWPTVSSATADRDILVNVQHTTVSDLSYDNSSSESFKRKGDVDTVMQSRKDSEMV